MLPIEVKMNLLPMHQQASHVKSSCKYVQIKSEQSEAFLEIPRKNIQMNKVRDDKDGISGCGQHHCFQC